MLCFLLFSYLVSRLRNLAIRAGEAHSIDLASWVGSSSYVP